MILRESDFRLAHAIRRGGSARTREAVIARSRSGEP